MSRELMPGTISQSMFAIGGFVIIVGALIGLFNKEAAVIIAFTGFIPFISSGFVGLICRK